MANMKKDTIYIHMFKRCEVRAVPNLSPFAVKVETWMRANKIPYEVVETNKFSQSTKQIPYIIYNGQEIADSMDMIEFVAKLQDIDLGEWLSAEQQAVSRAFCRMMDEGFSWTYFLYRYCYNPDGFQRYFQNAMGPAAKDMLKKVVKDRADMQGIGRKTPEDVTKIAEKDLKAISDYLGNKKFIHGDKMTMVDADIFAHLSQVVYVDIPFPHLTYMRVHCPNLLSFTDRVRDECWPDWKTIVKSEPFSV